jgi:hypothetical protein
LPKDFVCEGCKKPYALKGCFANHVLVCQSRSGLVEMNHKVGTLKRGLDEEAVERKKDVKRLETHISGLEERQDFTENIGIGKIAEQRDFSKNEESKRVLVFEGLLVETEGKSQEENRKRVSDYLMVNFPNIKKDISFEKVSFVFNSKKNINTMKVHFALKEDKDEILAYLVENNLEGVVISECVTFDTRIRRRILNVLARKMSNNSMVVSVPPTGSQPMIVVEKKLKETIEEIHFVDAICLYRQFLEPNAELEDVYKRIEALDQGKEVFRKFLVF